MSSDKSTTTIVTLRGVALAMVLDKQREWILANRNKPSKDSVVQILLSELHERRTNPLKS